MSLAGLLVVVLALTVSPPGVSQTALEERIRHRLETAFVTDSMEVADERIHARRVMRSVYGDRQYRPFWVSTEGLTRQGDALADWLESEPQKHGLRPADYHLDVVSGLEDVERLGALVDLEFALSDAFLMLASHLLAGRLNPETLDSEWRANRRHRDLRPVIEAAATMPDPGEALAALLPLAEGYHHFTLAQFQCKQKSGYPKYLVLRERLLLKLELLLEHVNTQGIGAETFTIMSGYRTPFYNAAIKNVPHSRHIYGGAADVYIDVSPPDDIMDDLNSDGVHNYRDAQLLYRWANGLFGSSEHRRFVGGLGVYKATSAHGPFLHIDARGRRARWGVIP